MASEELDDVDQENAGFPTDWSQIYEAIGEFIVTFATTEQTLVWLIADVLDMPAHHVEFICRDMTADLVQKLARRAGKSLGDPFKALSDELPAILNRFRKLTEFRNDLSHSKFVVDVQGGKGPAFGRMGASFDTLFEGNQELRAPAVREHKQECSRLGLDMALWITKLRQARADARE